MSFERKMNKWIVKEQKIVMLYDKKEIKQYMEESKLPPYSETQRKGKVLYFNFFCVYTQKLLSLVLCGDVRGIIIDYLAESVELECHMSRRRISCFKFSEEFRITFDDFALEFCLRYDNKF